MKESEAFRSLQSRSIIQILIEGDLLPYRSGSQIGSIGLIFGVPSDGYARADQMTTILESVHKENRTSELLNYLLSSAQLRPVIDGFLRANEYRPASDEIDKTLSEVNLTDDEEGNIVLLTQAIQRQFIRDVNEELLYTHNKLIHIGDIWDAIPTHSEIKVAVSTARVDYGYVQKLLSNANADLQFGDYDSVVTKSRTILESVFQQILRDHQIDYKEHGDLQNYRGDVTAALGMKVQSDWNPRVRTMMSGINKVVDAIGAMRNKDSDAHASTARVKIDEAEAELLLNASVSVATYYLRVADRQSGKKTH